MLQAAGNKPRSQHFSEMLFCEISTLLDYLPSTSEEYENMEFDQEKENMVQMQLHLFLLNIKKQEIEMRKHRAKILGDLVPTY